MPKSKAADNKLQLPLRRIVSGGQTGVDRAALDVAIELGIEHGGWCPRGRLSETGPIPACYQLQETEAIEYSVRTQRNVIDSDGTLILYRVRLQRGTLLTNRLAQSHDRPLMRVRLDLPIDIAMIQTWICNSQIKTLNVAGPRESSHPGIGAAAATLLRQVLTEPMQLKLSLEE